MFLGLALLSGTALSSGVGVYMEPRMVDDHNMEINMRTIGEGIGNIFKVIIIALCFMMLVDAVLRFSGRKLFGHGVFYVSRFIWWTYGSAVVWYLGGHYFMAYTITLGELLRGLYRRIYMGYFGSRWFTFWGLNVEVYGVKTEENELLLNSIFIESCILFGLHILEAILLTARRAGNKWGHLTGTLRRCASVYLCMYMLHDSVRWYSFFKAIFDMGATHKNNAHVGMTFALAVLVQLEVLWFLYEIFQTTWDYVNAKNTNQQSQAYTQPANQVAPQNAEADAISRSFEHIIHDITFTFVRKSAALNNKFVLYYNFVYYLRWVLYSVTVTVWYNWPRTIYSIFLGVSFVMYLYTLYIWIIGGFTRPAGFWVVLSELCIFVRHIVGFALMIDHFGLNSFARDMEDFWMVFGWASYGAGSIAEFLLLFEPFFDSTEIIAPAPVPVKAAPRVKTAPLLVDDEELFNKVQSHKTTRAQQIGGPTN